MKRVLIASMGASILLAACGGTTATNTPATGGAGTPAPPAAALQGTGATFPAPFYDAARFAYNQKYSQVTVNYNPLGSGAGISALTKKVVDFGASDVPMNATELTAAGGADGMVQIASTLGTVSLAYNLSGVSNGQLKLTPKTIA
jgi:phosphate transport system substrate-binding protein